MEIAPYLNFNGQCAAAFAFYQQVLGGTIEMIQKYAETPAKDHVPADWQDKVLHARLVVGTCALMGSDAPPSMFKPTQGMTVALVLPTVADGERIFAALSEGGTVRMPFQKTFWSPGFGDLVDRFGTPWMVNCS